MEPIRLITFHVGKQRFALPLDQVREVIRYMPLSPLDPWAGLLHGIIVIRGRVIPVLDLRTIFKEEPVINRKTRIIIVEMLGRTVGLVADQVEDIVPLSQEQLVPLSAIAMEKKSKILIGVANVGSSSFLVLDAKQMIHEEEHAQFREICLRLTETAGHPGIVANGKNGIA